ncbi:MAG: DNA polymerase-1, partial [Candidatus Omnitrophota bacterium]
FEWQDPDRDKLFEMYKDLEFKRWADEYAQEMMPEVTVAIDIKPFDLNVLKGKKQVSILFKEELIYLATQRDEIYQISLDQIETLKSLFEDDKIVKVVYDVKELIKLCRIKNITLNNIFDCLLAGYIASPTGSNEIKDFAWNFLKEAIEDIKPEQEVGILFELYAWLNKTLKEQDLMKLYDELEFPLAQVIATMESEGVMLDLKFLKDMSVMCEGTISKLTTELYKEAGEEFNINSPKQLSTILFEKLGLPVIKKTKTGFSTDESVLTTLALSHSFPANVLEYRHLTKLKSTYVDALPKVVDDTNRLHAQFVQTGTETGRLSSRNPNLQNIPIRTELGRQVRKAIIASDKDHILLAADYSQIELRVLAHISKDENLIKAFNAGQDIHTFTSSLMYDVPVDEVTKEMRYSAKRINFGIVYGMSAFALSKDLSISPKEAQEFINKYFERYPGIKTYMDNAIASCEKNGYVSTLLKRRRYIADIEHKNKNIRQFAQRQAINTPVQGSAADLMKLAMINMQNTLDEKGLKSKMIMTVHDELVFDVLKSEQEIMIELVREVMEHPLKLDVPTNVTIKVGNNWLEMVDV